MGSLQEPGSSMKYMSLSVLTVQNAVLILSMRYSRVLTGAMYFSTTAVVISEAMKMVICLLIIFLQIRSFSKFASHLYEALIVNWQDTLKMSVPAIVYMLQNNLQYVAVSNLEVAVFLVCLRLSAYTLQVHWLFNTVARQCVTIGTCQ